MGLSCQSRQQQHTNPRTKQHASRQLTLQSEAHTASVCALLLGPRRAYCPSRQPTWTNLIFLWATIFLIQCLILLIKNRAFGSSASWTWGLLPHVRGRGLSLLQMSDYRVYTGHCCCCHCDWFSVPEKWRLWHPTHWESFTPQPLLPTPRRLGQACVDWSKKALAHPLLDWLCLEQTLSAPPTSL